MSDYSKLKELAEGCRDEVIRSAGWSGMIEDAGLLHRDEQFLKECSPEAILDLIAENERLRADLDGEMAGARDFNLEHEELKHERDQLKAGINSLTREADRQYTTIEAYRKDAERYRWLSEKFGVTNLPCAVERILGGGVYVADGKVSIDAAIDAAMTAEVAP